jgi:NAD(P)-dependent dehydrogenase (short-subunit alcohol dehydrogenase family)
MIDLKDKSILITGGCSGMGRATAILAADAGAHVTIADLNDVDAEGVLKDIRNRGGKAQFVRTDVSVERDVEAMVAAAVNAYGKLDGAFNNAAISGYNIPLHELTADQFARTQAVNLFGVFYCMKHELIAMIKNERGAIVNNSAAGSVVAVPNLGDYTASKSGVNGLSRSGAIDYAKYGIRVNTIFPGTIRTPMSQGAIDKAPWLEDYLMKQQPINRLGIPEEVAHAAVFLLSDAASFITGAFLPVDGGFTV